MDKMPRDRLSVWLLSLSFFLALLAGCVSAPAEQAPTIGPLETPGAQETPAPLSSPDVLRTLFPTKNVDPPQNLGTLKATQLDPGALPTPFGAPVGSITPGEIDPGLAYFIDAAKDDLSKRLGIATDAITVMEARLVVWPDGSLGCPQPDMAYIQIPVDGSLILLEAGGRVYSYHTGGNVEIFLCENPQVGGPIAPDISK